MFQDLQRDTRSRISLRDGAFMNDFQHRRGLQIRLRTSASSRSFGAFALDERPEPCMHLC